MHSLVGCFLNVGVFWDIILPRILFNVPFVTRDVVNLWRGSNPDYNANKTAADVALALKQFKQIAQQPQNTASSRARYMMFVVLFMLSEI